MIRLAGSLDPLARVLSSGGFAVDTVDLRGLGPCLLAETPHALVLCAACGWETLSETVEEAQATLTNLAAKHPSARSWDLYVVLSIERSATEAEELFREQVEHDTRYARKFVLAGPANNERAVERALRPLLPLRVPPTVRLSDPLDVVRTELLNDGADPTMVDSALTSFRATGEVDIP
jgi:hypothetical protein